MDTNFGQYIISPLFTFVVGQDKKEITVHGEPMASLSTPLYNLINGNMLEATSRKADWSEVMQQDTFVRLCQYAYIHDYTSPACGTRMIPKPTEVVVVETKPTTLAESLDWGFGTSSKKKSKVTRRETESEQEQCSEDATPPVTFTGYRLPHKERSIWTRHLRDKITTLQSELTRKQDEILSVQNNRCTTLGNSHPAEDFTPVFGGHVELYGIADKYDIVSLKNLILYKIVKTLKRFTLCESNIEDIAALIRGSYENTLPRDPLRELVVTYVVSNLGQLGDTEGLKCLLDEGGRFVIDLWAMIWK